MTNLLSGVVQRLRKEHDRLSKEMKAVGGRSQLSERHTGREEHVEEEYLPLGEPE